MFAYLKATVRPWLGPAMRTLGLRRPATLRVPRVSAVERLREDEVATRVSVRADETLLVNGRPFFPIGLYYAQAEIADRSGAGLERLRAMGFNTIFMDGDLEGTETLDRVWREGLHVWYRPPGQLHGAFGTLKEVVMRVGRHPALLAWEMDDEPILNNLSFENVRTGSNLVRRIDPFHPILCNQWFPGADRITEVARWAALADMYGFGVYPIPLWRWQGRQRPGDGQLPDSIAVVGAQVALWRALAPGKPVIPALQAFAWNALEDADAGFPTSSESRFMAYHSVIAGAKGLHHHGVPSAMAPCLPCGVPPLVHADLNQTHDDFLQAQNANGRFWTRYHSVVKELAAMTDVFTALDAVWIPRITDTTAGLQPAPHIQSRVKVLGDSCVVLAVNASAADATVELRAQALARRTLNVWGDSRSIETDAGGGFCDHFDPFGVRIYSDQPDRLARASGGS